MKSLIQYGLIAAVIAGFYFYNSGDDVDYVDDPIDLNAVLDVTVDTLYAFQEELDSNNVSPQADSSTLTEEEKLYEQQKADDAFITFSEKLADAYNAAQPPLYTASSIGVSPQQDASLFAFEDTNNDKEYTDGEAALFKIEIDGENARIIASSRSGAVNDHGFSGTGLLAGYLLGSMLGRQRANGVNTKALANKKPITAKAAARARAGSGSHSRGK